VIAPPWLWGITGRESQKKSFIPVASSVQVRTRRITILSLVKKFRVQKTHIVKESRNFQFFSCKKTWLAEKNQQRSKIIPGRKKIPSRGKNLKKAGTKTIKKMPEFSGKENPTGKFGEIIPKNFPARYILLHRQTGSSAQ
jgi:hypothetical protein